MLPKTRSPHLLLLAAAVAAVALTSACRDEPTAPAPSFARGGGGGPKVNATDPDSTLQDTTLDVRVLGSGFDNGSRVRFALHGDTLINDIRTNATRFVSSSELVANITVAVNAMPDQYDVVVVTSQGKPGIGTEMFTVEVRPIELGSLGGPYSHAYSVNASGHAVGEAQTASGEMRAFFWPGLGLGPIEDLGVYPGTNSSRAYGMNDLDQVVGWSACSPGCPPLYDVPLLWERVGGAWGPPFRLPTDGISGQAEDINNAGQIVGNLTGGGGGPIVWTVGGIGFERLPLLSGATGGWVYAINDVGAAVGNSSALATLWFRDAAGSWTALNLGPLTGGTATRAYDIGEMDGGGGAWVAGYSIVSGKSHAVRWRVRRSGDQWSVDQVQDLGAPKGNSGGYSARGANTAGDAVGSRYWLATGTNGALPGYRGGGSGFGEDINNSRWVVGGAFKIEYDRDRATLWILR